MSLPSENIRTAAHPFPIIIAIIIIIIIIIIIVVVAIMQGYSIAFQRGPVRENVIKCSVFAVYLPPFEITPTVSLLLSRLCVCVFESIMLTH